jgi:hypothetical protein
MGRRVVISLLVMVTFSLVGLEGVNLAQADMINLYSFDFGSENSPVQAGWLQVTNTTLYSPQLGYGWNDTLAYANSGGAAPPIYPDMLCDFNHSSSDRTFEIYLAAGTYSIELYFYDNSAHSNSWTVYLGDSSTVLATVTLLPKDTEVTSQFDITVASAGQLDLRFTADIGTWQINGLTVAQEVPLPSTLLLMGTALLGVIFPRRGRKAQES